MPTIVFPAPPLQGLLLAACKPACMSSVPIGSLHSPWPIVTWSEPS
jgi:hypothetical protein